MLIKQLLREALANYQPYFHGSRTLIPFPKFNSQMDGTGVVSSGTKYGGFFFTDNQENAEFYTEWFVCVVSIKGILPNPVPTKHSPTILKQAIKDGKIYLNDDVLDGAVYSNVVVVPNSQLNNVQIKNWVFVGDEDSYFESLDDMFGGYGGEDEREVVNKDSIEQFFQMTGGGLDYALKVPIFAKYFKSRP